MYRLQLARYGRAFNGTPYTPIEQKSINEGLGIQYRSIRILFIPFITIQFKGRGLTSGRSLTNVGTPTLFKWLVNPASDNRINDPGFHASLINIPYLLGLGYPRRQRRESLSPTPQYL